MVAQPGEAVSEVGLVEEEEEGMNQLLLRLLEEVVVPLNEVEEVEAGLLEQRVRIGMLGGDQRGRERR